MTGTGTAGSGVGPDLRAIPLEGGTIWEDESAFRPVRGGGHLVSGGGLVGEVHGERGIRVLRIRGREVRPAIEVRGAGEARTRVAPGGWIRRIALGGDRCLVEEGLLADGIEALVVGWRLEGPGGPGGAGGPQDSGGGDGIGPPATVRLSAGARRTPALFEADPAPGGVTVALVPGGNANDGRLLGFFRSVPARALQRAARFRAEDGSRPLALAWTGTGGATLPAAGVARAILDGALPDPAAPDLALGVHAGPGTAPSIRMAGEGSTDGARAEIGIALLLLGLHEAAWRQLECVTAEARAGAHGFLHLAALWAGWSGRPARLLELEGPLRSAAAALRPGIIPPGGAAWPTSARLVHDLADALEPVADPEWRKALLARSALLSPSPGPLVLPPVTVFRSLDEPSIAGRRTVTAARLVRSWIAGRLGARAEMAWGRLTLAPILGDDRPGETPAPSELRELEASGLRAGDARLDFHCRREGSRYTFRFVQTEGRVPVNVVFDPWLPVASIETARLGGDPVELDARTEGRGIRARLQFPLDPERRLVIEGTPGN